MGNSLKTLCEARLTVKQLDDDLPDLLGSPHMRTKIFKNPRKATHQQLLILAELLEMDAYLLYDQYDVARGNLSRLEVANLKRLAC